MKVKILLVPLFLVISIMLLIWLVYPAFGDLQTRRGELKTVQGQVADIDLKMQKTMELMSSLSEKTREQEVVYQFLPDSQKEEEVIDALNNIASSEGVAISDLSVDKPKINLKKVVNNTQPAGSNSLSASGFKVGGANGQAGQSMIPSANLRSFETTFGVIGDYEKIRNVIRKVNKIRRFNNIDEFSIDKSVSQDAASGSLYAKLTIDFNYLEKVKTIASIDNQIFTSGKFDMSSVVDDIEKYKNGYVSQLVVDSAGKNNPFLP